MEIRNLNILIYNHPVIKQTKYIAENFSAPWVFIQSPGIGSSRQVSLPNLKHDILEKSNKSTFFNPKTSFFNYSVKYPAVLGEFRMFIVRYFPHCRVIQTASNSTLIARAGKRRA